VRSPLVPCAEHDSGKITAATKIEGLGGEIADSP